MIIKGDYVWFDDPDNGVSSGMYRVGSVNGSVYRLSNEDNTINIESFESELELVYGVQRDIRMPRHHDITVVIENGVCVDVVGLPEEWKYIVQDNDN